MFVNDSDVPHLKSWLNDKLGSLSDADSDVLADYVIALVRSDEPEKDLRESCVVNLGDFLQDPRSFVNEIFPAINEKAYIPGYKPPAPPKPQPPVQRPSAPRSTIPDNSASSRGRHGRKRGYQDRDAPQDQGDLPHVRAPKIQRRRGGGNGNWGPPFSNPVQGHMNSAFTNNNTTQPAGGTPVNRAGNGAAAWPIIPNDPAVSMMFLQAMGIDVNQLGTATTPSEQLKLLQNLFRPMFELNNMNRNDIQKRRNRGQAIKNAARQPHRSQGLGLPDPQASGKTLVIEQVPADSLTEVKIRTFFAEFGPIAAVHVNADYKSASIEFESQAAALKAHESPRAIFDNRFVKLSWYPQTQAGPRRRRGDYATQNENSEPTELTQSRPEDDPEFVARQTEAQAAWKERTAKLEAYERERDELDAQVAANAEERRKLRVLLAEKTGEPIAEADKLPAADKPASNAHTESLRAQLALLEQEALSLGLSTDDSVRPSLPTRGSFRGRYGRGHFAGATRGRVHSGVARLDNRPKAISLIAHGDGADTDQRVDFAATPGAQEALRTFLFSEQIENADVRFEAAEELPDADASVKNVAFISFPERYLAEMFLAAVVKRRGVIQGLGGVQLAWVKGPVIGGAAPTQTTQGKPVTDGNGGRENIEEQHVASSSDPGMPDDSSEVADAEDEDARDEEHVQHRRRYDSANDDFDVAE